jgi:tetratricopeptide (TPR) repeat protein/predicted Ser/Thr protein kinase
LDSREISHYRIIGRLGAGGMGEVFLAEDTRLERKVAIKMLSAKWTGSSQARQRLIREAKAAATLDHENICAIYEVGEEGDSTFIVMQYIEGESLSARISNHPLSPVQVADIGIQAAAALIEAHSHGIIHRDIKPHNVVVTPRGQVKILDFGLAKFMQDKQAVDSAADTRGRLTDAGQVVGTAGYMSPEQLRGKHVDARSDLFSLGVTLYECATGQHAFAGNTPLEVSLNVVQSDPPRPSQINPAIPSSLDEIIVKAMAKDAEARYQTAGALQADLYRIQGALGEQTNVGTRPLTDQPRPSRTTVLTTFGRRLRRSSMGVKIGLFALTILGILGIWAATRLFHGSAHQPSPEATRWYDRGASAIREGAYFQASKALERAVALDNKFALAHARLAETYSEIDYNEKAREELLNALSLAPDRSALSSLDAMYMDAIAASVRRDFASAIESYTKIADQLSDSEKASAYVDLGRSYEKNENVDKALEYYKEATKLDPQSAAGFLRSAILYGRRQELAKANEAFDRAEKIYQAMSSQEGIAEVFYQRGALLARIRSLAEAKTQLEKALEMSRNGANNFQSVRTQLQLSGVYFAEGDTERAKKIALEAIDVAQTSNIRNVATNGLIDLGYTLLSRGEFEEARSYFKRALDFAQTDNASRTQARAKLGLGSLSVQQGNFDEAISFLGDALKFYQPAGYRKETSNALVLLGRAYRSKGNYDVAFKTFEQQLELAKTLGDPAQVAASHSSMAILLGVEQERYPEALSHLDESYKINESLGAKIGIGFDQMNRARLFWMLGRYQEARAALDQAFSIANRPETSYKSLLAWVNLAESQMALSQRRLPEAKAKAQEALSLAGTQYKEVALQATHTIALSQALSGSPRPAKKMCEDAVATAKEVNSPRLLSSALLALAEVLLLGSDAQGALAAALQAQTMFASGGQQDSEWRALLIAALASQLAGNSSATQDYASRAASQRAGLQSRWGAESYDSYSRRPDIQMYVKQLTQLPVRSK